jgi:hypothetical protein
MNSSKKIKSSKTKSRTRKELNEFSAALELANTAQASAAKARAKATKAVAKAERAFEDAIRKGEALQERLKADKSHDDANVGHAKFDELEWSIYSDFRDRRLLITALGMLGSDNVSKRAAAALIVEQQRTQIGRTWNDLIVWDPDDDDDELDNELCDEEEPVA